MIINRVGQKINSIEGLHVAKRGDVRVTCQRVREETRIRLAQQDAPHGVDVTKGGHMNRARIDSVPLNWVESIIEVRIVGTWVFKLEKPYVLSVVYVGPSQDLPSRSDGTP